MGWQTFRFGQLYLNGVSQHMPNNPTENGDIPRYKSNAQIEIKEAQDSEVINWIKPSNMNLLIADRVLLSNVSWEDIAEQGFVKGKKIYVGGMQYLCRLLQVGNWVGEPSEWDSVLDTTTRNNDVWHWKDMLFWGMNTPNGFTSHRVFRGGASARDWGYLLGSHLFADIGFRPVLEPMHPHTLSICKKIRLEEKVFIVTMLQGSDDTIFYPQIHPVCSNLFQGIPDGSIIKMYALLCDGRPVRQDVALPDIQRKNNTRLELTDKFLGDEFLIPWVISNGVAIAAKPLLGGLSPEILNNYISSN